MSPHAPKDARGFRLIGLAIGAVGVVYGDIGTSPLYAMKECFLGAHAVAAVRLNIFGVLSLVFWSLLIVVVIKYLVHVLRADNEGEGGAMALVALVQPRGKARRTVGSAVLVLLGLFATSLLFGEGIITPAISVLSAVEGLEVATPLLKPFIVPITLAILICLFLVQRLGTGGIGAVFGPLTLVWFGAIGAAGGPWVLKHPEVLEAVNPYYAFEFFREHGYHAFVLLGSVVLCITGCEALYADMGHFGRRPIRVAWYIVVFPALLCSYFGQGALLLEKGQAATHNPFFALVPQHLLYPMVALATGATIVASQALISGAFSLTRQAVQLGYFPRVTIVHTSGKEEGQIYVPEINSLMMIGCLGLVVAFRSSSALAAAYGAAVTGTMTITTILFYAVMRKRMNRTYLRRIVFLFLVFDLAFLSANALKIPAGGWFPLVLGVMVFIVMTTWQRGRAALGAYFAKLTRPLDTFLDEIKRLAPHRVTGTAIFMTSNPDGVPPVLSHHLKHNKVLHERIVILAVATEDRPEVPAAERVEIRDRGIGFFQVRAHYGFIQSPNVMEILEACAQKGLVMVRDDTTFYLGRETLLTSGTARMMRWRKRLYAFLSRNSRPPTYYFRIPPDRVIEIGMQIEL